MQAGSEERVVIVTQTDRCHAGSVLGHGPLIFDAEAGRQAIRLFLVVSGVLPRVYQLCGGEADQAPRKDIATTGSLMLVWDCQV